eukprot:tig00021571_g22381.t1
MSSGTGASAEFVVRAAHARGAADMDSMSGSNVLQWIQSLPKLPPGSDQRTVQDHLRQFESCASMSKDLLSVSPTAHIEVQKRTGWALLGTLDHGHPVRQNISLFQSAEQIDTRELEKLKAYRAERARTSTADPRDVAILETLDEKIAQAEEGLQRTALTVTYTAIRRRLEDDAEMRNPDRYKALLDLPHVGEAPEAFYRRVLDLSIIPECREAHETPLMALMRHAGQMLKRRTRNQCRDFEDSEISDTDRRHMMTNFSTARKIYDELSQKIADREITGPSAVIDLVTKRTNELGAWDVDISKVPGSALVLGSRGTPLQAPTAASRTPQSAPPITHTPAVPVVPSRSNAGAGAGTRIMLATTVSEAEIAELEANAYGWDADDAEDQNAEVISFLQLIARDEPLVVVRALYPSASAPPPRLDDPVYQQKIKDFLKARGLPEKPRRPCHCGESHYSFECRTNPRPLPEWSAINPAKRRGPTGAGTGDPKRRFYPAPQGGNGRSSPPPQQAAGPRACYNCGKTGHLAASCPAQAQTLEAAVRRALAEHAAAAAAPPVPPATPAPWADPNAFTIARAMLEQAARSGAAGPSATALLPAPTGGHGSGPTAAPAPAELGKEKHVYRVRIVRSDEALVDDTFRAFTAAAAAHAAALQDPRDGPALNAVAAAATAFAIAVVQLSGESRPDLCPTGAERPAPCEAQDLLPTRPESGLDEGEKKVAFDAVDAALEEIALLLAAAPDPTEVEGADAAAKGPAPTPVPTSFPAELAAGIVDAALEEVALLLAAAPDPTEVEGADAEAKASLEVTDDGASLADEDATVASKETLRLNRARLLSASPGLDLTHFGAVELEPVKGREHELGPVPLWNVDAHKLKGAASVPLDRAAFLYPAPCETHCGCTVSEGLIEMLGHDPLSQDTLAHAWPTHYYEIMSLTHQASRVAAKWAGGHAWPHAEGLTPEGRPAVEPDAHKLTKLGDECVATAGWLEPYRRHWSIGQHSPVAASLEPHEMTVSGRRQLIELSELLPAQDRLRLACASTVAGYFLHRVDYGAPGTAGAVEKILGRFFKFAEPLMVDARVDAYGFALLALEHAIQWKTVACIGGRAGPHDAHKSAVALADGNPLVPSDSEFTEAVHSLAVLAASVEVPIPGRARLRSDRDAEGWLRAALAERLTAYRDGQPGTWRVGRVRPITRTTQLPLHGTTRGGQLPTIVPEELYVLSQLGPRPPLTALCDAAWARTVPGSAGAAELLRYIEGAKAGDRAHLVILFRRLLKKRAGFNDEAPHPTPLHDLPTTPKPASDTTGAYTAKAVSATIKEAKACLPPRPPVKALSPRDPPAPARPAPVPVPPPAPTAKLVTLHAAATWPPLASPMAPRPTAAPTPPATEPAPVEPRLSEPLLDVARATAPAPRQAARRGERGRGDGVVRVSTRGRGSQGPRTRSARRGQAEGEDAEMGERGDGDEAPEEAPPPPPPSAIDENLSQRALYEAMGVMSGVLAVPGCPPRLCEGKQITEWPMTARSDLAHRWSIPFDALKGTFEDLRVPHLKAFLASERSTPIQNRLDGPPVPHEEPPEGRVALRADRTVRLARLNAAAFELFMIALGLRGPVTPHSHDLPFHLHEWTEQQLEHFLTLRWTIPATRLPRWTHGGRFNPSAAVIPPQWAQYLLRAHTMFRAEAVGTTVPSAERAGLEFPYGVRWLRRHLQLGTRAQEEAAESDPHRGLALTAQRAAFQEKVLHALERHAARQSFTFDDALVGTYIADEPEPRLEPLDIDHVESEEEEGEKEEAPAAIPAAAHRPFEPHKDWQPRPLFSLADPTYANDHKLLREYMDRKHAFFRPLECYEPGFTEWATLPAISYPLRWQHAGDVDEYNVDVLTLQDQHMGELCSTMLKRVGPAARGIVNWFSLVGPPQRPFDEDPELFDLQGLAFPHAACGVSLDIVQYLAVGTRTAQSAVPTYTGAWDLTHEGTAHAPVCSTLGQVSRVLYTAFFHEGGGARNAPPPYMPHPERPTLHTSVLGGNIADPNEEDARTPFATRFARDVAVLALLRPLADKRVENVEGRLQTRRIYAPRLVAGTATPAPNAACDKDVAGGAPHQRENKKLWLAVTVAQLASQPKKSHANPRLVTAFGYELPPFPNSPPGTCPWAPIPAEEEILATAIGFTLAWHARFFQRHAPGKHLRSQHWADDFLSAAAMDVESERPADYVPRSLGRSPITWMTSTRC